jgi:signal transduction histidine kinase
MTFKAKLVAGLATAFAVLVFVAVLSYASLLRSATDREWVTHTHLVLEGLDHVLMNLIDAETGERGYILTADASYLQPYQSALGELHDSVARVRTLTADNLDQQRSLDRLEPFITARLAELNERIHVRQKEGLMAGVAAVSEGSGKHWMEQIRAVISGMRLEENRLLTKRSAEMQASAHVARTVIVLGQALGFLFLIVAGTVIQREMSQRQRAELEVRTLNIDLERRVAERTAELDERARDLERSNMELQQFAYVASHDLQEPLRTISSFTQLLAKRYPDKLDDKAREFINFAVDGCKRMQTLINDLLTFSRVGTQGKPLEITSCDAVLDRVLKSLKVAIQESGALITREPLPVVLADPGQLAQLFQNLLANAIKFRGRDVPRVRVAAEPIGTAWKISVRDNGIGISPEHNDRIFVIFQRLHTKTQYPGTGIGLAICRKIAERHGGRIWVEPSPGGGSTFCFTIAGAVQKTEEEQHELRTNATAN